MIIDKIEIFTNGRNYNLSFLKKTSQNKGACGFFYNHQNRVSEYVSTCMELFYPQSQDFD